MVNSNTSPKEILMSVARNYSLIVSLTKREIVGRYKGSLMGMLWPFITPLVMLLVYTFVFGEIFNARWHMEVESNGQFSLLLFAGLIIFNLYAECINRAPLLIISNVNYVKKVIFPLELLPVVSVLSALFHAIVSVAIWAFVYVIFFGLPNITIIYVPLILVPFVLMLIGFSWLLSALGTYVRDIAQVVGVITSALMFLSPVFFPLDSLPKSFQVVVGFNPLTIPIEQLRVVMFWGNNPDWHKFLPYCLASVLILYMGFYFFQKVRRGFADVI